MPQKPSLQHLGPLANRVLTQMNSTPTEDQILPAQMKFQTEDGDEVTGPRLHGKAVAKISNGDPGLSICELGRPFQWSLERPPGTWGRN